MSVLEMPNGDLVAVGYTNSHEFKTEDLSTDIILVRYNANGDFIEQYVFGTKYDDRADDIILDRNGDFVIVGSIIDGVRKMGIFKLTQNGHLVWRLTKPIGEFISIGKAIIQTDNGDYLIAGIKSKSKGINETSAMQIYTYSIDSNAFRTSYTEYSNFVNSRKIWAFQNRLDLVKSTNGFVISSFYFDVSLADPPCVQILELAPNRTLLQEKRLYGIGSIIPFKLYPVSGGYFLTGATSKETNVDSYGFNKSYAMILHLDESFQEIWMSKVGSEGLLQKAYSNTNVANRYGVQGSSLNQFNQNVNLFTYFVDKETGGLQK